MYTDTAYSNTYRRDILKCLYNSEKCNSTPILKLQTVLSDGATQTRSPTRGARDRSSVGRSAFSQGEIGVNQALHIVRRVNMLTLYICFIQMHIPHKNI